MVVFMLTVWRRILNHHRRVTLYCDHVDVSFITLCHNGHHGCRRSRRGIVTLPVGSILYIIPRHSVTLWKTAQSGGVLSFTISLITGTD